MTQLRGQWQSWNGRAVMPIFHPPTCCATPPKQPARPGSDTAGPPQSNSACASLGLLLTELHDCPDRRYDTKIHRRVTRTVMVGDVPSAVSILVVVQSMINEDTSI